MSYINDLSYKKIATVNLPYAKICKLKTSNNLHTNENINIFEVISSDRLDTFTPELLDYINVAYINNADILTFNIIEG